MPQSEPQGGAGARCYVVGIDVGPLGRGRLWGMKLRTWTKALAGAVQGPRRGLDLGRSLGLGGWAWGLGCGPGGLVLGAWR